MSSRRDYKSAATGQRRQRARRNGLLVVTLILVGLFGGLLAYIRGDRPQPPTATAVAPSAPEQPPAAAVAPAAPPKTAVAPAAEPEPAKPKYDFYTELPKRQIGIQSETAKPGNASQATPARMQPAINQLHKPSAPRRNAKSPPPDVAAASSSRSDSRVAKATSAPAKSAPAKPAAPDKATAKATPAPAKSAPVKPAASDKAAAKATPAPAKSAPVKPANLTAAPVATTPARTTQPSRPIANAGANVVVKTE